MRYVRLGLLVGVNSYDQLGSLRFSVQDVTGLKEVLVDDLRGAYKEEHVKSLVDGGRQPTKQNIVDDLEILSTKAGDSDEILFYFSGHGFEADGKAFVAPLDARISRPDESAIPIELINRMLRTSKARTKLVVFDACYSGLERGKAGSGAMTKSFESALTEMASKGSGMIVLTSCSQGGYSYEEPDFGHGVFTHFLIEGLRGNADSDKDYDITVTEIYQYVKQKVDEYSIASGKKQTPNLISLMAGDVVLVRVPKPAVPIDKASLKPLKLKLTKLGENHSVTEEGEAAEENAADDALTLSGELGAVIGRSYGPALIEKVESEYKFPRGTYFAISGSDEGGENFSAWAELNVDPICPGDEISPIVEAWGPNSIQVHTNRPVDLVKAFECLVKNGYGVASYVPSKKIESGQGIVRISVENLEVEAVIRLDRSGSSWQLSKIKSYDAGHLISLVVP